MNAETEPGARPARPSLLLGTAHLAALWALAFLQPMLSLLGDNPDFFVARENTTGQIIIYTLALAFVPPLIGLMIEAIAWLINRNLRWWIHLFLIAMLFAAIVLRILREVIDGPAVPLILLALLGGALLTWAYGHRGFVRNLADLLTPAPLVVLVVFYFFSGTSDLLGASDEVDSQPVTVGNPAPVVMVVFDEFPLSSLITPAGQVNAKRFPNFAELQKTSNWYRNTLTDAAFTGIAVPSIVSGKAAAYGPPPTADQHRESIFTLLGGSYRVRAEEPVTALCPTNICGSDDAGTGTGTALVDLFDDLKYVQAHLNLPKSMSSSLPDISESFEDFGDGSESEGGGTEAPTGSLTVEEARNEFARAADELLDGEASLDSWLEAREPARTETFDYVHFGEPHYPWTHYPNGLNYTDDPDEFSSLDVGKNWLDDGYRTDRARQSQLLETGYADHLLGRIISQIKADGVWDETMLVVAADHGGAMTKGSPRRDAAPENIGQIGMVPFFLKAPKQVDGRISDRPTCVTEILPLMAGHLGIDVPWESPECDRAEISVTNLTGEVVTAPVATAIAQRDAYVETLASLFGGFSGWKSVLRLGPNQDLIGTRYDPVATGAAAPEATATPDVSLARATTYDPGLTSNPVLRQRGTLENVAENAALAVSVNGRIAAVGEAYDDGGETLYSMLLPERALKPGRNDIRILLAEGGTGGPRLTELWSSASE